MAGPELEVGVLEDYFAPSPEPGDLRGIWIGRKICEGQRQLVDLFDLKKRIYIGNTSMEAELSLIMANQAMVAPGKLVYDPFVGTGSMLYTSAFFGSRVMGSDIDGRHIRGKKGKSVFDGATQYNVRDGILDCFISDLTQSPLRRGGFLDAIITDPPYGVRAGAKRLGRKDESKLKTEPYRLPDGTFSHERDDWVPASRPWEMSEVLIELLSQSRELLKEGGRLVYWLPTVTSEYAESDIPRLKGLRLVANSEQNFGKWARRLITMEKHLHDTLESEETTPQATTMPAHFDFRLSYFNRFESGSAAH
ncbi:MAG: hypothetical protein CYPHOPRED_002304 [Cyphobasidiales sp. Tagirdzhanova-0007]|nr:MAG: hypothetical protein CYPHOPRED_002304 [Cyphobasidiales sp. Tagirdzhanova-0007]